MKNLKKIILLTTGIIMNASCTKTIVKTNTDDTVISVISTTDSLPKDTIENKISLAPRKCVYLTIDDAPLNGSRYIDSVILKAKIKTNIFMVGNPIHGSGKFKKYHEMLKENLYIELYNHSYSHANHKYAKYYQNPEQVASDFEKNRTDFNLRHYIARLPGRNLWQLGNRKKNYKQTGAEAAALLAEKGYKVFGWDVEWKYDPKDNSPLQTIDELVEEIENSYNTSGTFTANHIVVLMHDQMFINVTEKNNLAKLIEKLQKHDFTFEYLSNYPDLSDD